MRAIGAILLLLASCARYDAGGSYLALLLAGAAASSAASTSTFSSIPTVQVGTATSTGNGTVTVGISSVDTSRSFLIFQVKSNLSRPVVYEIRGRIASSTTVEFDRATNEASTVDISFFVITYASGVSVQRGTTTMAAATSNQAITSVNKSQAFVLHSYVPAATDNDWSNDDSIIAQITTSTNLQFRVNSASGRTIWWEVVEFQEAGRINVQTTSTSMTGATLSVSPALTTSVDAQKSLLLTTYTMSGTGAPDVGADMLRSSLSSTAVQHNREISGTPDDLPEIFSQIIEFKDSSSVQSGLLTMPNGSATNAVALSTVDTSRSIALSSVTTGGGYCAGSTPYNVDDIVGVGNATFGLGSSTLTLKRNSTVDAATFFYQVIQFGN